MKWFFGYRSVARVLKRGGVVFGELDENEMRGCI